MDATPVMKLNSIGYLRLAYVATEITLHRRIMLALTPSTPPQLLQICRSVAQERFVFAIDFIQSLKPQHLSSFWYFASPQNFALIAVFGTLLLSTASTTTEEDFYKNKLREYRWTLKINSENGARYMGPAMELLDANMALMTEGKIMQNNQLQVSQTNLISEQTHLSPTAMRPPSVRGNQSSAGSWTDESPQSNQQLHSVDFTSPNHFSPYFPTQHSVDGGTPHYHSASVAGDHVLDVTAQEFDYGGADMSDRGWY